MAVRILLTLPGLVPPPSGPKLVPQSALRWPQMLPPMECPSTTLSNTPCQLSLAVEVPPPDLDLTSRSQHTSFWRFSWYLRSCGHALQYVHDTPGPAQGMRTGQALSLYCRLSQICVIYNFTEVIEVAQEIHCCHCGLVMLSDDIVLHILISLELYLFKSSN